ncbi:MAG TPA: heme-binding protein [Sphingobium sp.]
MTSKSLLALLALLPATMATAQTPPPPAAPGPTMVVAVKAAKIAVQTCKANGYTVAVSVVDSAGVLKALVAGDGARAMAVGSSQRKAVTAIAYGSSSADVEAKAKADPAFAAKVAAEPTQFARAGAQLFVKDGATLGAIGVGGAPGGEKDDACALAAIKAVSAQL